MVVLLSGWACWAKVRCGALECFLPFEERSFLWRTIVGKLDRAGGIVGVDQGFDRVGYCGNREQVEVK